MGGWAEARGGAGSRAGGMAPGEKGEIGMAGCEDIMGDVAGQAIWRVSIMSKL